MLDGIRPSPPRFTFNLLVQSIGQATSGGHRLFGEEVLVRDTCHRIMLATIISPIFCALQFLGATKPHLAE
jgi:hypothetical protein